MGNTFTKFFASFLAYGVANKKKSFSAVGHFAEGLAPAKGKIQWGYINKGYDIVIPLKYERAFSFKGGLTMVVLNSQYGYIDCTGQIKIPLNLSAAHSFEEECARRVCNNGLWGYIDKNNKEILPFKYDIAEPFYSNIARVGLYGKSMKINKQGSECL